MNKKSIKKIFRKLHLYTGFISGLIVFILSITGCCWVFNKEIKNYFDDYSQIIPQNKEVLSPLKIKEIAAEVFPGHLIHGIAYQGDNKATEVIFYEADPEFYRSVYINPYDGKVLHSEDHLSGFFAFVLRGHVSLWLPEDIGTPLTSYGTFTFLFIIISGIVLWWPNSKKQRKQRFTFDWNEKTKWKRKNYDLHSIVGFYASALSLTIAYTGVVIGLGWFAFVTYKAVGGEKSLYFLHPNNDSEVNITLTDENNAMHNIYPLVKEQYPDFETIEVHIPSEDSLSILVEVIYGDRYYDIDYLFYDQYSSQLIPTESIYGTYADANFSDLVMRMNYDIHVGSILGLTGKIIAFLTSLIVSTLPVTGFLMWYGRNFKKKNVPQKASVII
ncbi:PepSY domain-containing protein [Flammeovirga sp. EKP202]|uniref:PepSY-associated TM helix domain-containing protein n=1 Tax=Flammeovirga sp. EKP202 TaxID=2770592 RepID=UPI00165FF9B7|nr:PepSY-associated TM helix domain-containing protein [Flammeovirga sp. EKP202]MBD0402281.1 PepSY domain-containing protein [Flammeovirga sp. EKP202]